MGVTLMEQENMSYQNYAKKLQDRLKWAYQKAQRNNQKESECHKKYYDKKIRCMHLKPDDLVLCIQKHLLVITRLLIDGKMFHIKYSVN